MAFSFRNRTLEKVGVVGSGQIGPDIALYFSKVLAPLGVQVVVVDVSEEALAGGRKKLDRKVDRGVKSRAFSEAGGQAMKDAVCFTSDYQSLAGAGLIIEAASENEGIKNKIFTQLESIAAEDAILASNSSHMEPELVATPLAKRGRSCVIHYFFPAERNPIVEVIPGAETDPAISAWLLAFYEHIGKVPIEVQSRYGYAMDPIFEGVFQAAALCVEEGMGTTREVDSVATKALGLTIGPFTAMNLTGGNPITHHGLDVMGEKVCSWFRSPELMHKAMASGEAWETPIRGEQVEVSEEAAKKITERLQGSYLGLCDEVLSSGIVSLADFVMAVEIALDMNSPIELAESLGYERAIELIDAVATAQEGFPKANLFRQLAEQGEAEVPVVLRQDRDGIAVLTIRRPKTLNAMNQAVFDQLGAHLGAIEGDQSIRAAVIRGFGKKAFVSGADVNFLAAIETPEEGIETSRRSQATIGRVATIGKPVVACMNGLAFGGGVELAMACTARICAAGLRVFVGQPEPNLGIIPGAGGTQRLPRIIGLEPAAQMLRDGKPISSARALELGLVQREVDAGELLDAAIELAKGLADGRIEAPVLPAGPLPGLPESLPEVNIGHLSQAIDKIICRAVLEGAGMSLSDGLDLEARLFGDVCQTKDMAIGLENFMTNGPRAKAAFTHQ